jgi:hypothetical protein
MNDPMDQAGQPKVEFLALAEELHSYILSFLPWQDILRCTSVSHKLTVDVELPGLISISC